MEYSIYKDGTEKNGHLIESVRSDMFKTLLTVSESIAEVPHRQVAKWANQLIPLEGYHNNDWSDYNDSNTKKRCFFMEYCTHTGAFSKNSDFLAMTVQAILYYGLWQ